VPVDEIAVERQIARYFIDLGRFRI
jgi:hypothetical protein